ncbi:MAG TPA: hypothetical protein VM755_09895 [Stellaceae bacterium]|nr:hypothetical protein [Stellaceae bacterium]
MSAIRFYLAPTEEKQTRDCLDPWFFALFDSRRGLQPCCWHPPVCTVPVGSSLEEALNGPEMREVRRQLLTGELSRHCRECPSRALTSTADLAARVRQELAKEIATSSAVAQLSQS